MRKSHPALVGVLALALAAFTACAREQVPTETSETELAGTTSPGGVNPLSAQNWIDGVTIGSEVGDDGSIVAGSAGADFAPGEPIFVVLEVSDAPPASAVKVVWLGPGETEVGEQQKNVAIDQTHVSFQAPDTAAWQLGDHRVEVWVGDEQVSTQQFRIVEPADAEA
ncbi:MAG TPA: hypothetical protein VMS56_12825 [Thermoanaerobaculia bacterium]|nr:hypothetical protein [Thermoanaerobaculia bacterium]